MTFKKGTSGNKNGRPAGKTPGAMIRQAIEARQDELLAVIFDRALEGDLQACKLLLDRITPPLKPVASTVSISLPTNAGLGEQGAAVVKSTLAGLIPPDIGSALIMAISNQAKIIEVNELSSRIEALERRHQAK